ncbi:MAG: IS30 family transposase [Bacteroidetes bacterium]|nr:IS30 family transposase [Bacteroidota bacterium]
MQEKKHSQITVEQRYKTEALFKAGYSKDHIASQLNRHRSSIYRELSRNASKRGNYTASHAQYLVDIRKERFVVSRKFTDKMKRFINDKIQYQQWSPKQIVGYCKKNGIEMVSHEWIYHYIYEDKSKEGDLYTHLRTASKKYRKRYGSYDRRGKIPNRISIDHRSQEVNTRASFGHWEVDTLIGKNRKGAILSMVERKSRFTLVVKLPGKHSRPLAKIMINMMAPYKQWVKTITSDNGTEFAEHEYIAKKLNANFYFAHPYSSWERGTNENTNGLIRQYIPKTAKFDELNTSQLTEVMNKLNSRPRKVLGYESPMKNFMSNFDP